MLMLDEISIFIADATRAAIATFSPLGCYATLRHGQMPLMPPPIDTPTLRRHADCCYIRCHTPLIFRCRHAAVLRFAARHISLPMLYYRFDDAMSFRFIFADIFALRQRRRLFLLSRLPPCRRCRLTGVFPRQFRAMPPMSYEMPLRFLSFHITVTFTPHAADA